MFDGHGFESLIDRTFNGYRVTRFIARGGMGVVFEGIQESLDRPVAIKFLYPHLSDDDQFRQRFEREARAAARLNHPNIVRILDFGSDGPLHYMVLDLIDGESLRERLTRLHEEGSTLTSETILSIVQQVGGALSYAHSNGYVHRDIKPGNILVGRNHRAYLADFGVVKIVGVNQATARGVIIGTPEYMAPEQSSGLSTIGPAADLYSLAVVTYEMMVGRVPFQAPTPVAVMRMHASDPPPPPSSLLPRFPQEVEAVLMRALAKRPADRYDSVEEFVGSLTEAMHGLQLSPSAMMSAATTVPVASASSMTPSTPVNQTPPQVTDEGDSPRSNRRSLIFGGSTVFTLALLVVIFSLFIRDGDDGSPAQANDGQTSAPAIGALNETSTPVPTVEPTATEPVETATAEPEDAATEPAAAAEPAEEQLAILFASHRGDVHDSQIYVMNVDGSNQRQLTFARGHSWGPRATLDGTRFLFSSVVPGEHEDHSATGGGTQGSGNHDIYVADLAASSQGSIMATNITNITAGETAWDNGWAWSPDGEWIAFASDRDGNWEIYKMTPDGDSVTRLTSHWASDGWPFWTPDGERIIFSSDRDGNWELYSMNPDGSNVERLTDRPRTDDLFPEVSPDGKRIVFSSQLSEVNEGEIYLMDIDGSNITRLTNTAALNNIPSWCPDGERIVFVSDRHGNDDVYIINSDGTGERRLTDTLGEDTTPYCLALSELTD